MSDQVDSQSANVDANASQAASSQNQKGETQPGNLPAGAALADALLNDPEAREIARRKLQSEKDKGVDKAIKTAQQTKDQLEAFAEAYGIDLNKVSEYRRNKLLDDLYEERYGDFQPEVGEPEVEETQQAASSKDIDLLKQVLQKDDNFWNSDAVLKARSNDEVIRLAAKPQASPAQMPGGGEAVSQNKEVALLEAYRQEVADLKKANRGVTPPNALDLVKRKYRKKGLEVW